MKCFKQKREIERKIVIPKYDNIEKIGNKNKLLDFFEDREKEGYEGLTEWKIFKIGRTYFIEIE